MPTGAKNDQVSFTKVVDCPLCGNQHEIKYEYKGMPLLACPEADENKIYSYELETPKEDKHD